MRCDAGPRRGVGHLVRCVALAEEFLARGAEVAVLRRLTGSLGRRAAARAACRVHPGPEPAAGWSGGPPPDLDAVVLDSYELAPAGAGALRGGRRGTLAIVDGDLRGQEADLYLDQNLGAELPGLSAASPPGLPPGGDAGWPGCGYALLRDAWSAGTATGRPAPPRPVGRPGWWRSSAGPTRWARPRCWPGCSWPPVRRWTVTVVDARPEVDEEIDGRRPRPGAIVLPVPPPRPAGTDPAADLVVSAAGTSTWELLCLGAPSALVCVVDNQRESYAPGGGGTAWPPASASCRS